MHKQKMNALFRKKVTSSALENFIVALVMRKEPNTLRTTLWALLAKECMLRQCNYATPKLKTATKLWGISLVSGLKVVDGHTC